VIKTLLISLLVSIVYLPIQLQAKNSNYHFEETVQIQLPTLYLSKWEKGHQSVKKAGITTTRYYLNTESKDFWTQLINIQFKDKAHLDGATLEQAMQEEGAKSRWVTTKIHTKKENDILYERDFPSGEHELVRLIMTKKGMHRISYVKRGILSKEDKTQWIERLSQGEVRGRIKIPHVEKPKVKAASTKKAAPSTQKTTASAKKTAAPAKKKSASSKKPAKAKLGKPEKGKK
jgi:hypothetical protein